MAERWTQKRLERVGSGWQQRLFLGNWRLRWLLCSDADMDDDDTMGTVTWDNKRMFATIRIRNPHTDSLAADRPEPIDTESYIVHELLHLHTITLQEPFKAFKEYTPLPAYKLAFAMSDTSEEAAINHLAAALLALKREGGRRDVQVHGTGPQVLRRSEAAPVRRRDAQGDAGKTGRPARTRTTPPAALEGT